MPIDIYVMGGQYDFKNIPVTLQGHMFVEDDGFTKINMKECYYKHADMNFWGAIRKIENIVRFVLVENPIKLYRPNIVYYLENNEPSKDFEGLYLGGKFDHVKPYVPESIIKLGEQQILRYILNKMDFMFDEEGYPAVIALKKKMVNIIK